MAWTEVGFPGSSDGKEATCKAGDPDSIPGSGRFPGEGNGSPLLTPVYLPGESHGHRSLVGYSPWGRITEQLTLQHFWSRSMTAPCLSIQRRAQTGPSLAMGSQRVTL